MNALTVQETATPEHVLDPATPEPVLHPATLEPVLDPATPEHVLDPATLGDRVDRLFRAAWALCGSPEDAEDLVQETYARVLARPRVVRDGDDLGYLLRALRNTFYSTLRAGACRPRAAGVAPETLNLRDPRAGAAEPAAAAEAREVFTAIAALSADHRDALVAVDVAGLSYREAATALRVREGTITSRLSRAREQVAAKLASDPLPVTARR